MIKKLSYVCSLVAAVLVLTSAKTDKAVAKYDAAMEKAVKELHCVGLQTAIIKDKGISFSKAYGLSDIASNTAMTTSNAFKVGFCGRVVVPIAIYQLAEQKKLSLKDDISNYLGFELRNPDCPDVPITINHLLKQLSTLSDAEGHSEGLKSIANLKSDDPNFANLWGNGKPGVTFNKFTKGSNILAAVVEKVSGQRFDEYAQEHIFAPLGIKASYAPEDFESGVLATSYKYNAGEFAPYKQYKKHSREGYVLGESTFKMRVNNDLLISAEDIAKILLTIVNNGYCPLTKATIFSEETAAKMLKPNKSNKRSGCCSISTKWAEGVLFYNASGAFGGTSGVWGFDPATKTGFVTITNGVAEEGFQKEVREIFIDTIL